MALVYHKARKQIIQIYDFPYFYFNIDKLI